MIEEIKKIENKLEKLQNKKNEIQILEKMFGNIGEENIKYKISKHIIDKLTKLINELNKNPEDLHKQVSTSRYVLETLIITQLLMKEKDYFLKLYFSIYKQQENKIENVKERLVQEIKILEEYQVKYEQEIKNKTSDENEEIFQKYKNEINKGVRIFTLDLEKFGFGSLIHSLKNEHLVQYQDKLKEIQDKKLLEVEELLKKEWFKKYFPNEIKDSKEVFGLLEDRNEKKRFRGWEEKAKASALEDEYKLNYKITSDLMHFTSYSLFTLKNIKDEEIRYYYLLLDQYLEQIINNLNLFSKTIPLKIINMN